jgi:flagellar motor protein MotB
MKMRWMCAALTAAVMGSAALCAQESFMKPTAEELTMTSLPGYPGAAAVVLNREEITKDDMHAVFHYDRIKILTKDGEKYANVELPFVSTSQEYGNAGDNKTLDDISGRTIHADGTIIPFTGKPYLQVIKKNNDAKYQKRIFTLPDVEAGSIIEYRYATHIADNVVESPDWYVQGDLYVKSAHYAWYPTEKNIQNKKGAVTTITWFPILPPGVEVERRDIPHTSYGQGPVQYFDLTIKDVPPQVREAYMPPIASFSYRVLFNFAAEHTAEEWWKNQGKDWSKNLDSFADPNSELRTQTQTVIAGATTDEQKLQKIYAAVMALENTRYTRAHDQREDKAEGEGKVKNAADVLSHKRGNATQLTELFVGMARAAGMKAYFMAVPDRSQRLFVPSWLSFNQFDDLIAIVNVDGKEEYFDPGWRYCPYGHLAWQHTIVQGLRQVDKGTEFGRTNIDDYKANRLTRVANLKMDANRQLAGNITLTFIGAHALRWRATALRGDAESLNHGLRTYLERMLPKSVEVKVDKIEHLEDYEQPLVVSYQVSGTVGTLTGKRLILPSDLFMTGASATFTEDKRQQPVYFDYPEYLQDALRINLPEGFSVEAAPDAAKFAFASGAVYDFSVAQDAGGFTTRRNHVSNVVLVLPKDYDGLRKFYSQFESKDQESVVLKVPPAAAAAVVAPAGN